MSKKRRHSTNLKPGPFSGLYSHRILGMVVEALDLKHGVLADRTARRFFRGSSVNEYNRKVIFSSLAQALIDRGIAPELPSHLPLKVSSARFYGDSMEFAAQRWDNLMSRIQSRSSWDIDIGAAGECFLRLVAVDISVRIFAIGQMADIKVSPPSAPLWSEENGIGKILRFQLTKSGLTRDQLAAWMEVSATSVDNWLDGRNPPDDRYVDPLAKALARGDETRTRRLARELIRQFTLAKLCDVLVTAVGREAVVSSVESACCFATALSEVAGAKGQPEMEDTVIYSTLLLMGSESPVARPLLTALAGRVTDERSRADLLAAAKPWDLAYGEMLMQKGCAKKGAAGLAQDLLDVVDASFKEEAMAVGDIIRSELNLELSDSNSQSTGSGNLRHLLSILDDALPKRRSIVARFPDSPEAHYQLGSYLGMVAKHTGQRELAEESLLECRIASGLCPTWDAPAVERGIILFNVGDHEGALRELEQAGEELPEPTPHLRLSMGCVLTMLERFPEGLEQLEEVIVSRPDFGLTYSYAAHCAFGMGDKVKGRKYAKQARRLGEHLEYDAWRAGEYGGGRNGRKGGRRR